MVEKDWKDFKSMYREAGARDAFEKACLSIIESKFKNAHTVKAGYKGDGGIDVYVGSLGQEPIDVYQCKYFLDSLNDSQKQQIKNSLVRAVTYSGYKLKEWYLCLPKDLTQNEIIWFNSLKQDIQSKYNLQSTIIDFKEGTTLINYAKQQKVYIQIFNIEEAQKIDSIYQSVVQDINLLDIHKSRHPLHDIDKFIDNQMNLLKNHDFDKLKMLLQELVMNSQKHGRANKVIIKKEKNSIKVYDDGIEFNPLTGLCGDGGGAKTLQYVLRNPDNIQFYYSYENNENIFTMTFSGNDFITNNDCTLVVKNIELMMENAISELIEKLKKISTMHDCKEIVVDILESKIAISI
jgi:hypothetical protein